MQGHRDLPMNPRRNHGTRAAILPLVAAALGTFIAALEPAPSAPKATVLEAAAALGTFIAAQEPAPSALGLALLDAAPAPIYSADPNDSWNRIFYFLFSRRVETRLTDQFPEGAPFVDGVSTRTFERDETGDRAIDPLYPSHFVITGSRLVLTEPAYSGFRKALQDALDENAPRSTVARALMQSDLWSAHDTLFFPFLPADEKELGDHRLAALDLISRLIRKIALTADEIKSLPNNYADAVRALSLPDVFAQQSGWIEILWFHPRAHDLFAGYRRTSRVFVKLAARQPNLQKFLDGMPDRAESDPIGGLDGVALVTQLMLIDSKGKVEPTTLTSEVQFRIFKPATAASFHSNDGTFKMADGTFERASLQVCEISRKLFVRDLQSGGLILKDENSPAYNGSYGFAEGARNGSGGPGAPIQIDPPLQVTLRARCAFCHGDTLTQLNTFAIARPPHARDTPPVRRLDPAENAAADFVIAEKEKERSFAALRAYFALGASSASTRH